MANMGGSIPPPRQWWAFYVPAAFFFALGILFVICNDAYGSSDASRFGAIGILAFATVWVGGAIRYTVLHFQRRDR
jgi:hypothetical protein